MDAEIVKSGIKYIFVLLLILQTNSVYDVCVNHMGIISTLTCIFGVLLCFFYKKIHIRLLRALLLFLLYFVVFFIVNARTSGYYGVYIQYVFTFAILLFVIAEDSDRMSFLINFENVMLAICVISLVMWLAGSIAGIIRPTDNLYIKWGIQRYVPSYFGIYFESQKEYFLGLDVYRNAAIFTEAPMFALNILLAATVELYNRPFSRLRFALLCLAMVSTMSFLGVGFLTVAVILRFIQLKKLTKKGLARLIIVFILTIIAVKVALPIYELKFTSSISRRDDYIAGLAAWRDKPIFGSGFYNNENLISHMDARRLYNTGFSNSIMRILAQSGIYLLALYLLPCIYVIKNHRKLNESVFKTCMILILIYCLLLCTYSYNFLLFIAYGWALMILPQGLKDFSHPQIEKV